MSDRPQILSDPEQLVEAADRIDHSFAADIAVATPDNQPDLTESDS
jgi:hypothetical protein